MLNDRLAEYLYTEICHIPLIDPHSHIDPHRPTARTLDDILGYHYYTELAHSVGMDKAAARPGRRAARPRARDPLSHGAVRQHGAVHVVPGNRPHLPGFSGRPRHAGRLRTGCATRPSELMAQPDWEQRVLHRSNIEKVFLDQRFRRSARGLRHAALCPLPADRRSGVSPGQAGGAAAAGEGDRHRGRRPGQRCAWP